MSEPKTLDVKCPTCGQWSGQQCMSNSGAILHTVHAARARAWEKKQEFSEREK